MDVIAWEQDRFLKNQTAIEVKTVAKRDNGDTRYEFLASSAGRGWAGLDAASVHTFGGLIEHAAAPRIHLCMQIGEPVMATSRWNGSTLPRLQTPGDILIVPTGYAAAWEDDGPTQYLGIDIGLSLMRVAAEAMDVDFDRIALSPEMYLRDEKIEHIVRAIKAELEEQDPNDRVYAEGLGLSLAVHLLRRYAVKHANDANRGLTHTQLQRVRDYIREHHATNLSLFDIASVAGISPSHFKVLFKNSMGLPVHQYVIKCRVERAVELLSSSGVNISDVALRSGFADQSHMSRCMRRFIGLTPAQVRRAVS